jgi:hypothetical protein
MRCLEDKPPQEYNTHFSQGIAQRKDCIPERLDLGIEFLQDVRTIETVSN